jgi:protein-disulfide isomerase
MKSSGVALIVAAAILGASIVGAAVLLQRSIDTASGEFAAVRKALERAPARPSAAAPSRAARRGPDPERRYEVNLDGSPAKGPEDAAVTIVEFSDFQCPYCGRVTGTLDRIHREYGEDVRIVFKHLPLRIHPKAPAAHAAAEAAHRQGRFWEMHDAIFANQAAMSPERYHEYAVQIGLDMDQFEADLQAGEVRGRVSADAAEAAKLGVTGTPGFFVNGRFVSGALPFESFQRMIDEELGG